MSKSSRNKFLLGAATLLVMTGGFIIFQTVGPDHAIAQIGGEMPPMPVPVVTIEEKPVEIWKEFSGRIMAVDYVEIRPQVTGNIEKIHFTDGQMVKKGDLLYTIDPRPYEAAAALARAEVTGAKDAQDLAQKELVRAEELLKTGAISKAGYDERVNSQKLNKSLIAGANAHLKAALVDLDHTTIKAPIDGRISRPEITEGNLVKADAAPVLTTIVSEAEVYADFEVDEQTYLAFVRKDAGDSVEGEKAIPVRLLLSNDETQTPYEGTIKSFDNKINPSSGTIRARSIFTNTDGALLPGMFARVQIGSAVKANHITVPVGAILTDQSRKFVYVDDGGKATYREVKIGDMIDNKNRVVTSGLAAGDKVIVDGLMKIRAGAPIKGMTPEEMEAMKAQMTAQTQAQAGDAPPTEGAPEAAPAEAAPAEAAPAAEAPVVTEEPKAIPFEEPAADQTPKETSAPDQKPEETEPFVQSPEDLPQENLKQE